MRACVRVRVRACGRAQAEHAAISNKHDAILFVWKLHNIVTADGITRGQWPNRTMFPASKKLDGLGHLNVSRLQLVYSETVSSTARLQ